MANLLADSWTNNPEYVQEGNVPTLYGLEGIVENILGIIVPVVGAILLLMLIVGGFKYITSGGEKEAAAQAKGTLTYAVIGLVVVLSAWLVIRLLESFTGLDLHIFKLPRF